MNCYWLFMEFNSRLKYMYNIGILLLKFEIQQWFAVTARGRGKECV